MIIDEDSYEAECMGRTFRKYVMRFLTLSPLNYPSKKLLVGVFLTNLQNVREASSFNCVKKECNDQLHTVNIEIQN